MRRLVFKLKQMNQEQSYKTLILDLFENQTFISGNFIYTKIAQNMNGHELRYLRETLDSLVEKDTLNRFKNENVLSKEVFIYSLNK